jgi:His-Xaa-Ser system radical SAM maturase HxsB
VSGKRLSGLLKNPGMRKKEIVKRLAQKYSFLSQGTSLHIMVVTLRCNQKCVYCHASSRPMSAKGMDMSMETATKAVDFIFQSPSPKLSIEFQGGEPLANFETVKHIVGYAKKKASGRELLMTIVTNLSLMDKEKLRFLINNDVGICTSIDGPKFLHDKNRPNGYDPAVKWIRIIQDEYRTRGIRNRRINALPTITRESLRYPIEIVDEYRRLGFRGIHLRFINKLGFGTRGDIDYPAEEYIEFWKKAMDHILDMNRKGTYFEERLSTVILTKIFKTEPNYLDLRSPCGAAIGQLTYGHDGKVYSCDEGRMLGDELFMLGRLEDGYRKIIESGCPIVSASINDSQYCELCVYKPYCGICPVCNYAEQGSLVAVVPSTRHCRIYMACFDYIFEKLQSKETREILLSWIRQKHPVL